MFSIKESAQVVIPQRQIFLLNLLTLCFKNDIIYSWRKINYVVIDSVAQLDRAFDYESKGQGFESLLGHHLNRTNSAVFYF